MIISDTFDDVSVDIEDFGDRVSVKFKNYQQLNDEFYFSMEINQFNKFKYMVNTLWGNIQLFKMGNNNE